MKNFDIVLGDTRSNQMISLVVIHTIFIREHNRVSGELQRLNPHWNDEELFLEARRIVVAEMQVVIYKEFLPALLGKNFFPFPTYTTLNRSYYSVISYHLHKYARLFIWKGVMYSKWLDMCNGINVEHVKCFTVTLCLKRMDQIDMCPLIKMLSTPVSRVGSKYFQIKSMLVLKTVA